MRQFRDTLDATGLTYELVPPHQHRRNAAERAIRTFKNHFLAGLATCDPDFPLRQWDRLLDQAELTINLLRNSRVNPALSAWAYHFGNHDFNKVPLVPPGTRVILHSKPDQRKSWAFHGEKGWYVGPAPMHYRCVRCYIPKTNKERITDTVKFIPNCIPIPNATIETQLSRTADDLIHLLNSKKDLISLTEPNSVKGALIKIAQLLNRDVTPKLIPIICTPTATSEGERTQAETEPINVNPYSHEVFNSQNDIIPSSEGAITSEDIVKETITDPVLPSDLRIHAGLYANKSLQVLPPTALKPMQLRPQHKVKKKKSRLRMKHLERFIRQYDSAPKAIHKSHKSQLRKKLMSKLPPRQTRAYAPTPKGFIPPKPRPH